MIFISGMNSDQDGVHGEGCKSNGIESEDDPFVCEGKCLGVLAVSLHDLHNDKYDVGADDRDDDVFRVREHGGRSLPNDEISNETATSGGDNSKDIETEDIEFVPSGHDCA